MTLRFQFDGKFGQPPAAGRLVLAILPLTIYILAGELTGQAKKPDKADKYLEVALQIHHWLESVKTTDSRGNVTWPNKPDLSEQSTVDLYHGDAGVVRFYVRLYQATRNQAHLELAEAGAKRLLEEINSKKERKSLGLFTGISGHGSVLIELWQTTRKDIYRSAIIEVANQLEKTAGKPDSFGGVNDIISGSAGAGMFLIDAHQIFDNQNALESAIRLGDQLLEKALDGSDRKHLDGKAKGKRWAVSSSFPREYPNYSHGTAGIADFLLRLDQAIVAADHKPSKNGDRRFLVGAKQGAEYLNSVADIKDGRCLIFHNTQNGRNLYYLGWCHGPAGTHVLFQNLFAATRDEKYQKLVEQEAAAIIYFELHRKRTAGFWNNLGQCCGTAGVAEFMADQFERTGEKKYFLECQRLTKDLMERGTVVKLKDRTGIKWVHAENRVDPKGLQAQTGYMQGAAGIGCWLLRMHTLSGKQDKPKQN